MAIRQVAGDRQSGALKLELQQGMSPLRRILAKSVVLLAGWLVAMLVPLEVGLRARVNPNAPPPDDPAVVSVFAAK